jgi:hypothetical protein
MTDRVFIATGDDLTSITTALAFMEHAIGTSAPDDSAARKMVDKMRVTRERIKNSNLMRQDLEAVIDNKDDPHEANLRSKAWVAIRSALGGAYMGGYKR